MLRWLSRSLRLRLASSTCACSGTGKTVKVPVACGVAWTAVIVAGVPAVIWNVLLNAGT